MVTTKQPNKQPGEPRASQTVKQQENLTFAIVPDSLKKKKKEFQSLSK